MFWSHFYDFYGLGLQIDGMGSRVSFLEIWGWTSWQDAMPRLAEYRVDSNVCSMLAFADFSQDFGVKKDALGPHFEGGFGCPG